MHKQCTLTFGKVDLHNKMGAGLKGRALGGRVQVNFLKKNHTCMLLVQLSSGMLPISVLLVLGRPTLSCLPKTTLGYDGDFGT